ncbi:MAG TPA: HIT family protein [Clostridia bacterium]|nr:HIT family protein [Clostridia bacterium]
MKITIMDCPFCNLDKKRSRIVKEGKHVLVILSNPRLVDGHLLVIPKRHVEKASELGSKERKELFETVLEFQEKILSKFAAGCDIRQNYRPFQKQGDIKVNHLHFHLLPREFKDELYQKCQIHETEIFRMLTEKEKKRFRLLLS